jgi:SNF family Na+-dependent transporter
VEGFVTALIDAFPEKLLKRRKLVVLAACFGYFLLELPLVTHGGIYLLTLVDYYGAAGMTMLLTALTQTVAFAWVWGSDNIEECLLQMTGVKLNRVWIWCWKFISPAYITVRRIVTLDY